MKNKSLCFSALALGAVIALSSCAADQGQQAGTSSKSHGTEHQMTAPSESASGAANEVDMDFASGMKAHHEQALSMSSDLLGKNQIPAEVRKLAEQIKSAQAPEIELMESWLAQWGMPQTMDHQSMDHGEGMISPEDIALLEKADGPEAAKLFLEQMIRHHEGAVQMAKTEIADGSYPEAIKLSHGIVESQNQEIQQMKDLLNAL